jgi:hypothetical protein
MARVLVVVEPGFESDVAHWRGSYNPIGDVFRWRADGMARRLRAAVGPQVTAAGDQARAAFARRYSRSGKRRYAEARVTARELAAYRRLIFAAEVRAPDGNFAVVASGHNDADHIESGGVSRVAKAGEEPLTYRAYGFLRGVAGGG